MCGGQLANRVDLVTNNGKQLRKQPNGERAALALVQTQAAPKRHVGWPRKDKEDGQVLTPLSGHASKYSESTHSNGSTERRTIQRCEQLDTHVEYRYRNPRKIALPSSNAFIHANNLSACNFRLHLPTYFWMATCATCSGFQHVEHIIPDEDPQRPVDLGDDDDEDERDGDGVGSEDLDETEGDDEGDPSQVLQDQARGHKPDADCPSGCSRSFA